MLIWSTPTDSSARSALSRTRDRLAGKGRCDAALPHEARAVGRSIGLDVHRDFCEVAIAEDGTVRSAGRVETTPEALELFAGSLGADDRVAFEVSDGAWEIARILGPHVERVIVVSPDDTGIRQARAKTERLDARTLARLLAAGELDAVWMPDERRRVLRRRLARREQLVRSRSRAKNEIHAVPMRRLKGRPPVSDLLGIKGRRWLSGLELPLEEAETIESALRHEGKPEAPARPTHTVAGARHDRHSTRPARTGVRQARARPVRAEHARPHRQPAHWTERKDWMAVRPYSAYERPGYRERKRARESDARPEGDGG
jgi:Transposase